MHRSNTSTFFSTKLPLSVWILSTKSKALPILFGWCEAVTSASCRRIADLSGGSYLAMYLKRIWDSLQALAHPSPSLTSTSSRHVIFFTLNMPHRLRTSGRCGVSTSRRCLNQETETNVSNGDIQFGNWTQRKKERKQERKKKQKDLSACQPLPDSKVGSMYWRNVQMTCKSSKLDKSVTPRGNHGFSHNKKFVSKGHLLETC